MRAMERLHLEVIQRKRLDIHENSTSREFNQEKKNLRFWLKNNFRLVHEKTQRFMRGNLPPVRRKQHEGSILLDEALPAWTTVAQLLSSVQDWGDITNNNAKWRKRAGSTQNTARVLDLPAGSTEP